jgi:hypothetical protein
MRHECSLPYLQELASGTHLDDPDESSLRTHIF